MSLINRNYGLNLSGETRCFSEKEWVIVFIKDSITLDSDVEDWLDRRTVDILSGIISLRTTRVYVNKSIGSERYEHLGKSIVLIDDCTTIDDILSNLARNQRNYLIIGKTGIIDKTSRFLKNIDSYEHVVTADDITLWSIWPSHTIIEHDNQDILRVKEHSFIDWNNVPRDYRALQEAYADFMNNRKINYLQPPFHDYIYYPYIDVITQELVHGSSSTMFNTRLYGTNDPIKYQNLFNRFDTRSDGLFIQNSNRSLNIIPKIIHVINSDKTVNLWKRYVSEQWQVLSWSITDIINLASDVGSPYLKIIDKLNDDLALLAYYMIILEEYGGIVVDQSRIPINPINNDILSNYFVTSFKDNPNTSTNLSMNVIAAVPNHLAKKSRRRPRSSGIDPARKPFEGINSFFIETKLANKNKQPILSIDDKHINKQVHILYDNIYRIVSQLGDYRQTINELETVIKTSSIVTIYPGYYFDLDQNNKQMIRWLKSVSICKRNESYNDVNKPEITRTELSRNHIQTPQSINRQLDINPKNRYMTRLID